MDNACKHSFRWWENTFIGIQQPSPATNRELIVKDVSQSGMRLQMINGHIQKVGQ